MTVQEIAVVAKKASIGMACLPDRQKNAALEAVASALRSEAETVFAANARDLARAEGEGLAAPSMKRLKFDLAKLDDAIDGILALARMEDPNGKALERRELAEGLALERVSCPIGVIGMVFESRPDALVQIASLCLKSGNSVLLKGGREARETNAALAGIIAGATEREGIPAGWIANLETREDVEAMLSLDGLVDLMIPRGSNAFVKHVMDSTSIPVLGHADGVCHVYVHDDADAEMAVRVCVDSKTQYVSACNAAETFLVHADAARRVLPPLAQALSEKGVEIRGCPRVAEIVPCVPAIEADWDAEYLDLIVSIRIVDSLEAAVEHVNEHGSRHTESIVTRSREAAERFMDGVDSASAFWNASTRFADGFRYGLGAEVGISTSKIHARGPVGLDGLMIYKWKLRGSGDTVADFAEGRRKFTHRDL